MRSMPTYAITHDRIPELPGAGRLGRHYRLDSRSARYPYIRTGTTPASVTWARHIDILDQGNVGSCTGNAAVGSLGTDPLWPALPATVQATLNETLALQIYSEAELIDGDGPYPPNDNGSTGTSVCQAARNDGWISGYTWCSDTASMLDALQHGPVLIGVNWYDSFDTPTAAGVCPLPSRATIRGGHELVIRQYDAATGLVWFDNSWGLSWGIKGRAAFPMAVMGRLFAEQGDCAVPLPVSAPAPAPVPGGPYPQVMDGRTSLRKLAQRRNTTIAHLLAVTGAAMTPADEAAARNCTPPKGMTIYTTSP